MTELTLSDGALLHLRIAPHALWEVMASAALLVRQPIGPRAPYTGWMRAALRAVSGGQGAALVRWASTWPGGEVPRFLLFPPVRGGVGLREACQDLRAHPPASLRRAVMRLYPAEVPTAFRRFVTDPAAAVADLCTAVEEYVATILQPSWSVIADCLNEEVSFRAGVMATCGMDELLSHLHRRIGWSKPTLTIETAQRHCLPNPTALVLVPMLFAGEQVIVSRVALPSVAVGYQVRGVAGLSAEWGNSQYGQADRAALLLGKTRTALLRALGTPCTTTGLAQTLGLAPSTVSEHLAVLVSCRIANRRRRANRVYYGLSDHGVLLLQSLHDRNQDPP